MEFQKGEPVVLQNEHNKLSGRVLVVSPNQKVLAIAADDGFVRIRCKRGMILTFGIPLLQKAPGVFVDLYGEDWTVSKSV